MNWYDPSDESRPIITPQASIEGYVRKYAADHSFRLNTDFLMSTAGGDDAAYLRTAYSVREEPFLLPAFLGKRPIYTIEVDPPISLVQRALAAPVAVDTLEVAIALGARNIFLFGFCGAVGKDIEVGDIIIPTAVKREEGTSYHYTSTNEDALPDEKLTKELYAFLNTQPDIRLHTGKTVTTDAVFRQTLNKELAWRDEGILGVDMEMSALLAVADFYGLPAVCILVVSDKHMLEPSSEWHWGGKSLAESQVRTVCLFVDFIKKLSAQV